ncbi:MAG: tRNA1(Val) (adenine(37)-N6)-methyltransferase [Peptococcaceae bacterium]|jgi:tRNA1(Val) A37 N6-methylase TrmN6|nr:tRNA1(Val) (adenine(37)-N6)-methyltransferase [Peptococcaceae bacterium]MDH7525179.1 tRNA1(Val) (adenine(37)-N6)-methyltransferase [Peptococcaceae bacterium]
MVATQSGETLDDLLINGLKIIQKSEGFRVTLDSVLLAHFATVKNGDRIVDLGTGNGVIPLILNTRAEKLNIWGVEIQEELVEMARRSVKLNGLEERIAILRGDIRDIHKVLGGGCFTLVTANPPHYSVEKGRASSLPAKALARHEISCVLEDVVASAGKLLNHQGRFALIHRVERLVGVIDLLRQYGFEPRKMRFIHAYKNRNAKHFLLEARKNASPDLKVLPPLLVYDRPGKYSGEILEWYGKGENEGGK